MKNSLLFSLVSLVIIYSCVQNNEPKNVLSTEKETTIRVDTVGNQEIEKNLKDQLNNYLVAFNGGDPDIAISYCYPDMFVWMKQQFPAEYSMDFVKETFKKPVREMKKMVKEKKLSFEFKIGEITRRIDLGKDKIYTIVVSVIVKKDFDEISMGDEVVAITIDNGMNWKFIQKDPETTPDILKMKFSQSVVQQVMRK